MNRLSSSLNKNYLVVIASFSIAIIGCSDDPISPVESIPINATTIGTGGGTIQKDDFTLTIPAGAFDKNYDISVSEIADDGAFGENTVSSSYMISGIPNNYSKPLKMIAKYSGKLEGESYLGVGRKVYNIIAEDSSTVYELYTAADSSEYLFSTLPPSISTNSLSKSSENNDSDILAKFLSSYTSMETQHFTIKFPSNANILDIIKVGEMFEDAFSVIYEGLQMPLLDDERIIEILSDSDLDSPLSYNRGTKITNYNIPLDAVKNQEFNKVRIAALVYIFFRSCDRDPNWITIAITYWLKDLVSDDPDYKYPSTRFLESSMLPFKGIILKDNQKYHDHAIGFSSIIKYLTKFTDFDLKNIGSLYKNNTGDDKAIELFNNVGTPIAQWWPDFIEKYISDKIYDFPNNYFFNNADHEWTIITSADTEKVYSSNDFLIGKYPNLSAKLFRVNLNYQPPDDTYKMLLDITGPVTEFGLSLVLFGTLNDSTVYLGSAHAQDYEIPNLKEYYDAGMTEFLIVLVNSLGEPPYTGESDIDLTIKFGNNFQGGGGPPDLNFNHCTLELYVKKLFERQDGTSFEQESVQPISAIGSMIGNRFVADYNLNSGMFVGTVELVLDESANTITYLNWIDEYTVTTPSTYHKTEITAVDIPVFDKSNGIYKLSSNQTCIDVTNYSYYQDFQGNITTLKSFECNTNSYLEIRLYFEE